GDLALLDPAAEPGAATASFERAFTAAESVGARMPQLRAAVRLCRTATDAERDARLEALRTTYAEFTEGLSTRDLREAAELLSLRSIGGQREAPRTWSAARVLRGPIRSARLGSGARRPATASSGWPSSSGPTRASRGRRPRRRYCESF